MINKCSSALLRRAGRIAAGVLAAALILPVPAMALTFTSGWTAAYSQSGGPTPPKPTFTDAVSGQRDDLTVDMGTYNGSTAQATSNITLTRGFSITSSGGQDVFAEADYASYLASAGFTSSETVKDSHGNVVYDLSGGVFSVNNSSATTKLYTGAGSANVDIPKGNYTITVTLTYKTNNKMGSWKMKSKHHFEAMGE